MLDLSEGFNYCEHYRLSDIIVGGAAASGGCKIHGRRNRGIPKIEVSKKKGDIEETGDYLEKQKKNLACRPRQKAESYSVHTLLLITVIPLFSLIFRTKSLMLCILIIV